MSPRSSAHRRLGLGRTIGAERQAKLPLGVVRPEGAGGDGLGQVEEIWGRLHRHRSVSSPSAVASRLSPRNTKRASRHRRDAHHGGDGLVRKVLVEAEIDGGALAAGQAAHRRVGGPHPLVVDEPVRQAGRVVRAIGERDR